jgi:hypothetical protein
MREPARSTRRTQLRQPDPIRGAPCRTNTERRATSLRGERPAISRRASTASRCRGGTTVLTNADRVTVLSL